MTVVLAIDPGSERSAWLLYVPAGMYPDGSVIGWRGIEPNEGVLDWIHQIQQPDLTIAVIEQIESYGMAVGREVFATVHWSGRFTEALEARGIPVVQLPRRSVKVAICHDTRAKDANIRQALIDRFGGPSATRKGGPLYGIKADLWSALALAITYTEGGV